MSFCGLMLMATMTVSGVQAKKQDWVYFGTFASGDKGAIYRSKFDPKTGAVSAAEKAYTADSPSFMVRHPKKPLLYSLAEKGQGRDRKSHLLALGIDEVTGALTLLNSVEVGPTGDCHLGIAPNGSSIFAANYSQGIVAGFAIQASGEIGKSLGALQFKGSSITPRQTSPHAHSVDVDRTGKWLLSCDLGTDKVNVIPIDQKTGLQMSTVKSLSMTPGFGPRHLAFHPKKPLVYVINELAASVTVCDWDAKTGELTAIQTVKSAPDSVNVKSGCAEIYVSAAGTYLLASNRVDHNSVATFAIDPASGKLTPVSDYATAINHPRHFALPKGEKFVLIGNMNANNVSVCAVAPNGTLTSTGHPVVEVPSVTCILFSKR